MSIVLILILNQTTVCIKMTSFWKLHNMFCCDFKGALAKIFVKKILRLKVKERLILFKVIYIKTNTYYIKNISIGTHEYIFTCKQI